MKADIPRKYRKLADRAYNTSSKKAKIRFFCLECCGFSEKEVTLCADEDCVLHKIRETG